MRFSFCFSSSSFTARSSSIEISSSSTNSTRSADIGLGCPDRAPGIASRRDSIRAIWSNNSLAIIDLHLQLSQDLHRRRTKNCDSQVNGVDVETRRIIPFYMSVLIPSGFKNFSYYFYSMVTRDALSLSPRL